MKCINRGEIMKVVSYWVVQINKGSKVLRATSIERPFVYDTKSGLFVVLSNGKGKNYINVSGSDNFSIEPVEE